jgi:hypothetical protein
VRTANAVCKLARSVSQEALEILVKMMRNAELPGNRAAQPRHRLAGVAIDVTVQRVLAKKLCACTIDELREIEQHLAEQVINVTADAAAEAVSANNS